MASTGTTDLPGNKLVKQCSQAWPFCQGHNHSVTARRPLWLLWIPPFVPRGMQSCNNFSQKFEWCNYFVSVQQSPTGSQAAYSSPEDKRAGNRRRFKVSQLHNNAWCLSCKTTVQRSKVLATCMHWNKMSVGIFVTETDYRCMHAQKCTL